MYLAIEPISEPNCWKTKKMNQS